MRRAFTGLPAARGLALGRARVRQPIGLDLPEERITPDQVEHELERLHQAVDEVRRELAGLRQRLHGAIAHEIGEFLDTHALLLDDPELREGIDELVRTGHYSAAYALKLQRDRLAAVFDSMDDPYFRSRREDIDQVIGRVRAALRDGAEGLRAEGFAGEVLIAETVAPSELAQLSERGIVAVVTSEGSPLSHSAILARSLHLPLLVGAHEILTRVRDGEAVMVDAGRGEVIVEPDGDDLRDFRRRQQQSEREVKRLSRLKRAATRSRDGRDVALYANAESREDVAQAYELGAVGIGLFRTEFLFMHRRELPDEEEQFRAYRDLVLGMDGRPVTIRTLDLGADKADASGLSLASEPNPALGVRGVRLSLRREDLFRLQLRAILRASGYGPVRVLVPMVSSRDEVRRVRHLAKDCARDLRTEGYEIADHLELGAMIEVPAAAMAAKSLAAELDFLSLGTNDLVQYLLAADRNNDALGDLYSPLHPAVLRLLHDVIAAGRQRGIPVMVCGEIAGDPAFTRMLLALGLDSFSLHPDTLLEVRRAVREADIGALEKRRQALLRAADRRAIERVLEQLDG